jgi:hypothetical protein
VHHHVERSLAEVGHQPVGDALDREVGVRSVAPALAHLGRGLVQGVVLGIERVDALELQLASARELERLPHATQLEQLGEDAVGGWPRADADRGARLGELLGDREPEAGVVRDAAHERAPPLQVDGQHERSGARWRRSPQGSAPAGRPAPRP